MSALFIVFIGICYLGFMVSALIEGRFAWAGVGLCWGVGNLLIGYLMTK